MKTYPLHAAPVSLLTRRQLHARGLRPGRQLPVAQATCHRGRKTVAVPLYDLLTAEPTTARAARRLIRKTLGALHATAPEVTA